MTRYQSERRGRRRVGELFEAAKKSIGRKESSTAARTELMDLLNNLETYGSRVDQMMEEVNQLQWQVTNTKELLKIVYDQ